MSDPTTNSADSEQIELSSDGSVEMVLAGYRAIENVKLTVVAELDRGTISMGELLRLEVGDILPFARPVGENIDLFAADVLIGNAEILAVNEKLAVRVADVNRKVTSSQAKKNLVANSTTGSALKIRRLGSNEL
jgi:flagellar motor switch/type III secretory pathway protein FliN